MGGTHPTIHNIPPPLRYTGSMGATVVHIGLLHGNNVQLCQRCTSWGYTPHYSPFS